MTRADWRRIIKVACMTAIGAPPMIAAVQGFTIPPAAAVMMGVLALAAGYTLGELEPGYGKAAPAPPPAIDTEALVAALLPALTEAVAQDQERRRIERIRPLRREGA